VARVTVEDCLDKAPSRFALVMLVSKRAKQILKGSKPVLASKNNKAVVTALREVAAGRTFFDPEESDTIMKQIEENLSREVTEVPASPSVNGAATASASEVPNGATHQ